MPDEATDAETPTLGPVLQLKIRLLEISPMVWRRLLVPGATSLRELHGILQVAMGWEGFHLFQFHLRAVRYGSPELSVTSPEVTLQSLQLRSGSRFIYEYDLNVSWRHELRVEQQRGPEAGKPYPLCLDGHGDCPPEDRGGPAGYLARQHEAVGLWKAHLATGRHAMRVRILLQVAPDDGDFGAAEAVATLTKKSADRLEEVGLSLADSKAVLASLQRRLVGLQAAARVERHRHCAACGKRLRSKGSYPIVFRSLFGDVRLASPRFHRCRCREGRDGPATISPLKELLSDHVAPERLYLETRWASLAPYAATAAMLADVLPIGETINATTIRAHVLRMAERVEAELGEERPCFIDGCPAEWRELPPPEGRIVVGLDGGYVRDWSAKTSNFEIIVGRSLPEDRAARYLGLVHGHDSKPKRRLFDLLTSQGLQANQDVTFLTDGGDEIKALTELVTPCGEHVLDSFHIAMRLTVLGQYIKGVAQLDEAEGTRLLADIERIKWRLWHGDIHRALEETEDFEADVDGLEVAYPSLGRFRRAAHEFAVHIAANAGSVVNYGERFRTGERISSAFVESTVNTVVGKRFAKKQQMQWTRRGAHLLLQTRTRALDGTLRATFERWYPGLANDNAANTDRAAAA